MVQWYNSEMTVKNYTTRFYHTTGGYPSVNTGAEGRDYIAQSEWVLSVFAF